MDSPPQNRTPAPPPSIFVQGLDKNSRRIMLGEEQDSCQAKRGCDWSCKVGGRGGRVHTPFALRREGSVCVRKRGRWPSESKRCRTQSTRNNCGAEHTPRPASRLLIPRLPHPVSGFPNLRSGSPGSWRQKGSRARCVAWLGKRTWRCQVPGGCPSLGTGATRSHRGLAPHFPSPSPAATTRRARNRNRGRKKSGVGG